MKAFLDILSFGPDGWGHVLMMAALVSVSLAVLGFLLGAIIGVFAAWAKISGGLILRAIADGYTTIIRGIPDLLVIYLFYFGGSAAVTAIGRLFGAQGFVGFPAFLAGVLAIGISCGAHHTEVFRGAFRAVSKGELEAASACGMGQALKFRRIIAPLALRHALPGLGNVWQVSLKESALISVVGVVDILRQAQIGAGSTGLPFNFFLIAGALYLLISSVSGSILQAAERHFSLSVRRAN
ncbi:ABC transporter permease [Brucellaceae bacterium D45D]